MINGRKGTQPCLSERSAVYTHLQTCIALEATSNGWGAIHPTVLLLVIILNICVGSSSMKQTSVFTWMCTCV